MKYVDTARPYAKAAFEYAKSHDTVESWAKALDYLTALMEVPSVQQFVATPRLPSERLAEVLLELSADLNAQQQNFLKLLVQNTRLAALPAIKYLFDEALATDQGQVQAELVTAEPVDALQVEQISKALSAKLGKTVTVNNTVDGTIIGGAIIKTQDWVMDGSLKAKLGELSKELMKQG